MAKVRSHSLRGKSVNVPHSEHRHADDDGDREKNVVTFDEDGVAEVSDTLAAALLEFYPKDVEQVQERKSSSKSKK